MTLVSSLLWLLLALVAIVLLVSPPKLDLDPISSAVCFTLDWKERWSQATGQLTTGHFDPVANMPALNRIRKAREELVLSLQAPLSEDVLKGVRVSFEKISGVPCVVYRPVNHIGGPFSVLVVMHGGGFVIGGALNWHSVLTEVAHHDGMTVVSVEYSLSPESRFPVAALECSAVVLAVSEGALGPSPIVLLAGDSAGGALAVAAALHLQHNSPAHFTSIKGMVLLYPFLDLSLSFPSILLYSSGYYLTLKSIVWFKQQYLPPVCYAKDDGTSACHRTSTSSDSEAAGLSAEAAHTTGNLPSPPQQCAATSTVPSPHLSVLASPAGASDAQLSGFPACLVITAEADPLRDEGEAFAHRLARLNVPVVATRYNRTVHAFMMVPGLPARDLALLQWRQWMQDVVYAPTQSND